MGCREWVHTMEPVIRARATTTPHICSRCNNRWRISRRRRRPRHSGCNSNNNTLQKWLIFILNMINMKAVQQKHIDGCGPAALATVLGISYDAALKIVHPNRKPREPANTWPYKLQAAMRRAKLHYEKRILRKWSPPKCNAIVNIQWLSGERHWVVWSAGQKTFLDPVSERVLQELGRYYSKRKYINAFNRGRGLLYKLI